jgi:hypothetical protein
MATFRKTKGEEAIEKWVLAMEKCIGGKLIEEVGSTSTLAKVN